MHPDSGTCPNSGVRPDVGQSDRRPGVNGSTYRSDAKKEVSKPRRGRSSQKESVRRGGSSSSPTCSIRASSRSSSKNNNVMRRN